MRILSSLLCFSFLLSFGLFACTSPPSPEPPSTPTSLSPPQVSTSTQIFQTETPSPQASLVSRLGYGIPSQITWSPDASLLAVATASGVHLLDGETFKIVQTIGSGGWITCLAFSRDGRLLALGQNNGSVRIWDFDAGEFQRTLEGSSSAVSSLSFSPDGNLLAIGRLDSTFWIWSVTDGTVRDRIRGHSDRVTAVAFGLQRLTSAPESYLLSSASRDGTILGWNSVNGRSLFLFNQHTSSVNELVFAPLPPEIDLSNERMVSAGDDGTVRFWLPQNNQLLLTLTDIPLPGGEPSPDSGFLSLAFTSDGFILAGGNRDGKISLWNGFTGEPYRSFNAHPGIAVQDLSFRPGTSFLTSLGEDGILRVWNANPAVDIDQPEVEPLRVVDIFSGSVNDLAASPDGTLLASAHDDGAVRLWDLGTGSLVSVFRAHNGPVNSVAFHPAGELVVSGGNDGSLRIWDITQINGPGDPLVRSILGHRNLVLQVAFSPDGLHVLSASADGTLRLWEPETGAPLGILRSGQDWITALAYSPDGTLLAVGDERGVLQVWNTLPPGAPVLTDNVNFVHQGPILSLAFSGDSTLLASGGEDAKIVLQKPSAPENTLELSHHTRRITGVAFNPSGTNAAGVGTDGILSIWNSSEAELVFSFTEPWPMNTVTYLPSVIQDVELVLTGSLDGTIHLWRITLSK